MDTQISFREALIQFLPSQQKAIDHSFDLAGLSDEKLDFGSPTDVDQVNHFFELISSENKIQNLTRIEGVDDFLAGHFVDALVLGKVLGAFAGKNSLLFDIGSGGGIPALLCYAAFSKTLFKVDGGIHLTLVESEGRKADFLSRTATILDSSATPDDMSKTSNASTTVIADRFESILFDKTRETNVTARAVASLDLLFKWMRPCSTWNMAFFLKGPNWKLEWEQAKKRSWCKSVSLKHIIDYSVPRGTTDLRRTLLVFKNEKSEA